MALTKKVMILFDPEKYKKLEMKARLNKKSVGALIRDTLEDTVIMNEGKSRRKRMEAARKIISVDEKPVEWDEIEKLIARGHVE